MKFLETSRSVSNHRLYISPQSPWLSPCRFLVRCLDFRGDRRRNHPFSLGPLLEQEVPEAYYRIRQLPLHPSGKKSPSDFGRLSERLAAEHNKVKENY